MNVIMISTDVHILESGSTVQKRMQFYGNVFTSFHVFVLSPEMIGEQKLSSGVHIYSVQKKNRFTQLFFAVFKIRALAKTLSGKTVVSSQDAFETGLVAWLSGKPFQLQIHTDIGSAYFRKGWLNKIRLLIASFLLPRAHGVRVVSRRIESVVIETYGVKKEKVSVLPIRADIEHAMEAQPKKFLEFRPTLLTVARLEKEKNVRASIDVLNIISKKYPDAGLVVAGEGGELNSLKRYASNSGVGNKVIFLGNVPTVFPYLRGTDIMLVPSMYEGYGLMLVEAAAAGAPIVTTDVGIVGDCLIHNESALVCPVNDVDCLALSVEKLIEDSTLRSKLATNAHRAIIESIPPEKAFLDAYKKAIENCCA